VISIPAIVLDMMYGILTNVLVGIHLLKLKRITLLWENIRSVTEQNQALLMGETREMLFAD
jgi:hypothetical protein